MRLRCCLKLLFFIAVGAFAIRRLHRQLDLMRVRKGLSDAQVKFLGEKQALIVQIINSLRDAASTTF
jgi:hypothetical protein